MTVPVIVGVVGSRLAAGRVKGWRSGAVAAGEHYLAAVARAGASPVVLTPRVLDDADASALLSRVDALLLTGGPDVDPAHYGEVPHDSVYGVDEVADGFEL